MSQGDLNPYAPPQSNVTPPEPQALHELPMAGAGKRFLNYFIDRFVIGGLFFVLGVVLVFLEERGMISPVALFDDDSPFLVDFLITGFVSVMYYSFMESVCGRTLGKLLTGTRVVTVSGKPLTFCAVIGRSLSRLVPFEPLSFLGSDASGWHDQWTDTRVVDLRAKPIQKPSFKSSGQMPRLYRPPAPAPKAVAQPSEPGA